MANDLATAALQHGLDLVDRVLQDELAQNPPPGVLRLAERAGLDKGQASRMLKELCGIGFLHRDSTTRGFRAGSALFRTAARAGGEPWGIQARSVLRRLGSRHGASAYLSVLSGGAVLVVRAEPSAWAVSAGSQAGRIIPAWCSGAGRALLLEHTADALGELFTDVEFIGAGGPAAPRTVGELAERIERARGMTAVVAVGEFEQAVIEVAAPIRDRRGEISAAVSIALPWSQPGADPDALAASVGRAAAELTSQLAIGS
jgi:DNA-binding IclR family transcriptional regulator